jgi:hypothetical protein
MPARRAALAATAAITDARAKHQRISVHARGAHGGGVGRADFVLVDLTRDAGSNVVDCKGVDYLAPLPTEVSAAWTSAVALTPGIPYRLFFHLYDRTTASLVAYDSHDFSFGDDTEKRGNDEK